MSKGLLFFCCACCILVLTIINLSIGPVISGKASSIYGTQNCAILSDTYDYQKERDPNMSDETKKYDYEWGINECKRKKAMHNMEYTSFIFDIVIGFVCGLIGLLHLFDLKKDFVSNTGLIGLGCGVVGFVLTFVYVIYNGIVYTNYYDAIIYKKDGDGAFAKRVEAGKYECIYFDEKGNNYAYYAKYSDLNKKQYNYNKDLEDSFNNDPSKKGDCTGSYTHLLCDDEGYITASPRYTDDSGSHDCEYLYYRHNEHGITNKDKSDRFLTALILSLFVCLANIGLALFGFLLFKNPSDL